MYSASKLEEAIAQAEDGDTIKLGADITLTDSVIVTAGAVTIDLNGYNITRSGEVVLKVDNASAKLTITGEGTVTGRVVATAGELVIDGGTYIGESTGFNYGTIIAQGANSKVTINDATVNSAEFCFRSWASAQTIINGGTFNSDYWTLYPCEGSTLTINGGTFTAGADDQIAWWGPCNDCSTSGVIIDNIGLLD